MNTDHRLIAVMALMGFSLAALAADPPPPRDVPMGMKALATQLRLVTQEGHEAKEAPSTKTGGKAGASSTERERTIRGKENRR